MIFRVKLFIYQRVMLVKSPRSVGLSWFRNSLKHLWMAFPVVKRQPPCMLSDLRAPNNLRHMKSQHTDSSQTTRLQDILLLYQLYSMYFNVFQCSIVSYRIYFSSLFPSLSPQIYYINITLHRHTQRHELCR